LPSDLNADYLVKTGLVTVRGIAIPLFETFIQGKEVNINEKITFDVDKNEIFKGGLAISENLSSSEFRLLKFLIENKDRTVEKEELINAVWTQQKTQEGVTDQAFDQIIYRLRKKIEND